MCKGMRPDQGHELAVEAGKASRNFLAAMAAFPRVRERIVLDAVPVAHDERRVAMRAEGSTAFGVVHVAGVDILQARIQRNAPGAA